MMYLATGVKKFSQSASNLLKSRGPFGIVVNDVSDGYLPLPTVFLPVIESSDTASFGNAQKDGQ